MINFRDFFFALFSVFRGQRFLAVAVLLVVLIVPGCRCLDKGAVMLTVELNDNWQFRQKDKDTWLSAEVPGCVHTDLLEHKIIDDPFYRDNENKVQWIDKQDWEYQTLFTADGDILEKENIALFFEGLDTYTQIYLNDTLLLKTDNMFRQWRADVKQHLREGENTLRILFLSPTRTAEPLYKALGYELPGGPKVMTRKPGYHYGWDWGPKLTTSGIWRPVYLKAWNTARIESLQFIQESLTDKSATLSAVFEIGGTAPLYKGRARNAQVSVRDQETNKIIGRADFQLAPGTNRVSFSFQIKDPKRWWTNGLGDPHLYRLEGLLKAGNQLLDHQSHAIGLRTIELVTDKDEKGETFYFKLNGKPVFMKGANYIPQDSFVSRVSDQRYKRLISQAKEANMNMLRVWGGGFYENDIFYDLCDEAGILVWQDFMFACAMPPGGGRHDKVFVENVKQEAIQTVIRLRNHPCIALWCGDNEIDEAWHHWGWQNPFTQAQRDTIWEGYKKIFHDVLPGVIKQYDSQRFYWPSSPKFGRGNPRSLTEGDAHYWGVWHDAEPFDVLKEKTGRFMSEFGFQAFPPIQTVKKFALPEDFSIESPVMKVHQKHPRGNALIRTYMERDYPVPSDFEHFLYVSNVLQAEGMRIGLEAQRRAMPFCMGTLYWQLNDCWPVVSWSGIDYYGNWKALHYFVKKAFAPILVSPVESNGNLKVFIVSDRPDPTEGELSLRLLNFTGEVLWKRTISVNLPGAVSKRKFETIVKGFLKQHDKTAVVLQAQFRQAGKVLSTNLHYFVPPKSLQLSVPVIQPQITVESPTKLSIVLTTDTLSKNLYLQIDGAEGHFSDNYFDLLPGEPATVTYTSPAPIEEPTKKLKIISLKNIKAGKD